MKNVTLPLIISILLLLQVSFAVKNDTCVRAMRRIIKNYQTLNITYIVGNGTEPLLLNTAKGYNDLGNFDACEDTDIFKFGLMTYSYRGERPIIFEGLCVPYNCTNETLDWVQEPFLNLISKVEPNWTNGKTYVSFPMEEQ